MLATVLLSHTDDGGAEMTCCDEMSLPSNTDDDAAEATWLSRDIDIKSC
jgi:hypothetical protein